MNGIVRRRSAARHDLVTTSRCYAREAGVAVADRFLAAAEATFTRLAGMPGLGTPYEHGFPMVGELRFSPIARFRKQFVFYRPIGGGVEIVRVLHGARDLDGILADEFGVDDATDEEDGGDAGPAEGPGNASP